MNRKIEYIKLDVDDIMEILLEHYQQQFRDAEYATGKFLGTPDNELRFIAMFGNYDDPNMHDVNFEKLDKRINYNGEHAFLRNNPDFFVE